MISISDTFDSAFKDFETFDNEFQQEDDSLLTENVIETRQNNEIFVKMAIKMMMMMKEQGISRAKAGLLFTKHYLEKYPSLKTFGYSACVLSVVPIGLFVAVFLSSLFISIATAAAGVFFVQSGVFVIGLGILAPVEIGVLALAGGVTLFLKSAGSQKLITLPERFVTHYESKLLVAHEDQNTVLIE